MKIPVKRQGNSKRPSARTHSIFTVSPDDLSRLKPTEAVFAFRDLLWSEARRHQIPISNVSISATEIPDGGIDALVMNVPATAGAFVKGQNYYQIKAGASEKPWTDSWIRKELFIKPRGKLKDCANLRPGILTCLEDDGRYVMAFSHLDLTTDRRKRRKI